MPDIKEESDVYRVGSLAKIKTVHDSSNPFLPYYINLFPQEKAQIVNFVDAVAPLSRVTSAPWIY